MRGSDWADSVDIQHTAASPFIDAHTMSRVLLVLKARLLMAPMLGTLGARAARMKPNAADGKGGMAAADAVIKVNGDW